VVIETRLSTVLADQQRDNRIAAHRWSGDMIGETRRNHGDVSIVAAHSV
jgi:hypothetical protein